MTAFLWQAAILISIAYIAGCFFGAVCRLVFAKSESKASRSVADKRGRKAPQARNAIVAHSDDDLKRIRGVGPQLERRLKNAGITSFNQIAMWNAGDVEKFAGELRLGSKVEQQDWVGQAKGLLAASG